MKYRKFDKIGMPASLFGLGCMRFNGEASGDTICDEAKAIDLIRQAIDSGVNYMDTAYIYLNMTSETLLGKALQDGYRDKVTIATKMPIEHVNNYEEMEALLNTELKKLQTDHIDYYLMHGINKEKWLKFKEMGADRFFEEKKREGKIRYKCFSFHGEYEDFEYIIKDYDWDMVQIQYNYMDTEHQAGTRGLELAGKLGIPVVIMEGLLGGNLAKAPDNVQALFDAYPVKRSPVEWGLRWLAHRPEIMTILSGCNEAEQIEENVRILSDAEPGCMTHAELELMESVKAAYEARTKIGCTGCSYCMPCPSGVNIPSVFKAWNEYALYGADPKSRWTFCQLLEHKQTPENCIECGACMAACPQHLQIIDQLKTAWTELNP